MEGRIGYQCKHQCCSSCKTLESAGFTKPSTFATIAEEDHGVRIQARIKAFLRASLKERVALESNRRKCH